MRKELSGQGQFIFNLINNFKIQEATQKKIEEDNKQEKENESKRVMRELGVTAIFEGLRDSKRLPYCTTTERNRGLLGSSYYKKETPAIIRYSSDTIGITFSFLGTLVQTDSSTILRPSYYDIEEEYRVYVEKRDDGLYVGGGYFNIKTDTYYRERKLGELKAQSKYQLPELIAKALHTINPYL